MNAKVEIIITFFKLLLNTLALIEVFLKKIKAMQIEKRKKPLR